VGVSQGYVLVRKMALSKEVVSAGDLLLVRGLLKSWCNMP
jgi:hypothetical protein